MATKKKKNTANKGQTLSPERLIKERMRGINIGKCYCSADFATVGEGLVVVSREHTGGNISFCVYLIDTFCMGLRDAFWRVRTSETDLNDIVHSSRNLRPCDYNEAHNWVYGAIAWAEDAGIEPCKEWRLAQYFLEEDNEDVPLIELPFGRNGKHFLFADNQAALNRYLPSMYENLGDDFEYAVRDNDFDDFDDDFNDDLDNDDDFNDDDILFDPTAATSSDD